MNNLIASFGGRKYFYCQIWCGIATALLATHLISSVEWAGLVSWFFTNVVIANHKEAVAAIKVSNE